jgi:polyhydroxyalkanoate synthesis regulator phasin
VEIGNGVKIGEFTVEQAERLYASWVDRNKATQSKSIKERNDAINELRNQYQTVFKRAKVTQRESIFDRLKHKITPTRRKSIPEELTYVMQITVRYTLFIGEGLNGCCLMPGQQ